MEDGDPGRESVAWDDLLIDIRRGNARVAAIIAASLVQMTLKVAIEFNMVPLSKSENKEMFEGTGPLSSFSAQIAIGYGLGLFGKKVRHDLHVIRRIRNDYAHTFHAKTLSHKGFADFLAGLHSIKSADPNQSASERLASAVELLCLFLIMRTSPTKIQAGQELLAQLSDLDYSTLTPLKRREYTSTG